ncbi:hypothetical protein Dsin_015009 [Dipteronia sinensis]|uniref:Reverse transcriptase zinc-binding domain-containing protein n=1 Tax=Dipteronia sinensis TaxID=43782 RepID=A0AAE0AP52_9ROSI|nr:hypothetical protein Dsin_015009 [Dipteronia sinensis]
MSEWTPLSINLRKRNVPVNYICHCCNLEEETLEHALFWCKEVSAIWKKTALWSELGFLKGISCCDVLQRLFNRGWKNDLAFVCMVMWGIWYNRNCRVHGKKVRTEYRFIRLGVGYVGRVSDHSPEIERWFNW